MALCSAPAISGCSDDDDTKSPEPEQVLVPDVPEAEYQKFAALFNGLGYSDDQIKQIAYLFGKLKQDAGSSIQSQIDSKKDEVLNQTIDQVVNNVIPDYIAKFKAQLSATFIKDLCDVMQANAAMFVQLGIPPEVLQGLMAGMQQPGAAKISDPKITAEGFCVTVEVADNFAYLYKLQPYIKPLLIQVLAKENYNELRTICALLNKSLIITIKDANSDSQFTITIEASEMEK